LSGLGSLGSEYFKKKEEVLRPPLSKTRVVALAQ